MVSPMPLTPRSAPLTALPAASRLRRESLLLGVIATLMFTLGIWNQAPQGFDGRWAVFLGEMFRHGPSFFATTYGQPYPDYPGTATWLSWLAARVIGAPNHLANVLPPPAAPGRCSRCSWWP